MDEQPKGRRRWLGRWLERYGFKEVVAAFIALLIVGSTVVLSFVAVAQVGHSQQMQDAMDLLAAMSGLVGVVLGYYFGRVPAERHADAMTTMATQLMNKQPPPPEGGTSSD